MGSQSFFVRCAGSDAAAVDSQGGIVWLFAVGYEAPASPRRRSARQFGRRFDSDHIWQPVDLAPEQTRLIRRILVRSFRQRGGFSLSYMGRFSDANGGRLVAVPPEGLRLPSGGTATSRGAMGLFRVSVWIDVHARVTADDAGGCSESGLIINDVHARDRDEFVPSLD